MKNVSGTNTSNVVEKVIIYTRVSSKKQVETGNWLESQEQLCKEWIRNQGGNVELVRVFSDGWVSGKYVSREGLDEMIEFLKKENRSYTKISRVIIDDIDRIIRDVAGWRDIKNRIEKLGGAKIFSLKQDLNDTPEGKMLQSITMSVKQYERENNARRTRDRQRGRLLDGYRCYSVLPWYKYAFEDEARKKWGRVLVFSEPNASIMREWLTLFSKGILVNITSFVDFLRKKWLTTSQGKVIKKSSDIDRVFIKEKLLFYCGYLSNKKLDVDMVKGRHPALIDESIMDKILEILNPKRYKVRIVNSKEKNMKELPLRGSLCCESCHRPMTGSPSKNKLGNYYYYYTCRHKECTLYGKSIWNKRVHAGFEEYLEGLRIHESRLWLFGDALQDIRSKEQDCIYAKQEEKVKRITCIQQEIERVQERIFNSEQNDLIQIYEKKLLQLSQEKESLQEQIDPDNQLKIDIPNLITNTSAIIANPLLVREKQDHKLKRLLLSLVFGDEIFYNKKTGIQTPRISLIYSALKNLSSGNTINQGR